jgi:hypothetical protein
VYYRCTCPINILAQIVAWRSVHDRVVSGRRTSTDRRSEQIARDDLRRASQEWMELAPTGRFGCHCQSSTSVAITLWCTDNAMARSTVNSHSNHQQKLIQPCCVCRVHARQGQCILPSQTHGLRSPASDGVEGDAAFSPTPLPAWPSGTLTEVKFTVRSRSGDGLGTRKSLHLAAIHRYHGRRHCISHNCASWLGGVLLETKNRPLPRARIHTNSTRENRLYPRQSPM